MLANFVDDLNIDLHLIFMNRQRFITYCGIIVISCIIKKINFKNLLLTTLRPAGRLVMQRTANPCSSVRFRGGPPTKIHKGTYLSNISSIGLL